jgi:hypothetical protein
MNLDLSTDFDVMDNKDSLTLQIDGQADQVIAEAISEPVTFSEAEPAGGQIQQGDVIWVWSTRYSTKPPLGSILVDENGDRWTVLSVTHEQHVETYAATTRNLDVVYRLDNFVSIYRATYAKNNDGEAIPTWVAIVSSMAARVQSTRQAAETFEGTDWTDDEYRIIMQSSIGGQIAVGDIRIVDADGNRYRVNEYIQSEQIDKLPVAICSRVIEGAEYEMSLSSSSGSSSSGSSSSGS